MEPNNASSPLGGELLEWIIVTIILTIAIFAILQAVGSDLEMFFEATRAFLMRVLSSTFDAEGASHILAMWRKGGV